MYNQSTEGERMKLGLYFAVCDQLDLHEALDRVLQLGYESLEISTHTGARFDLKETFENGRAKRAVKTMREAGLSVSAVNMSLDGQLVLGPHHSDTDVIFEGTAEQKILYGIERMLQAGEFCSELEIPAVTGFTGCEDYSRWFPWPDPDAWQKMEPVFVERWSPILERYDELGIRFGMECHPKQIVYNTETAIRSLELLGTYRSWCFNLDPANLMLAGVDPVVFASEIGKRVINVHAKDGEIVSHNSKRSGLLAHGSWARKDRGFRFRIPGWGDVPWKKLITELFISGYQGPLTVEHEDPTLGPNEGIQKAAQFLGPLLLNEPFSKRWW